MRLGQKLVIFGAFLGAFCLSFGLYNVATALSYGEEPVAESESRIEGHETSENIQIVEQFSNDCEVSGQYPQAILKWCALITKEAQEHGLPPDLVAAVVLQESGGRAKVVSRDGAVGLMQVMPRDGKAANFMCVNGPCFSNRPTINELGDPAFNLAYGTELLARLEKRNGNMRDALRDYGPMGVGYYYADKVLRLYQNYGN